MIVGGCRSVFPHLLTTKVQENQPWRYRCVCGELQVAATASKGAILGNVSFIVSRLPESAKKGTQNNNANTDAYNTYDSYASNVNGDN